MSCLFSINQNNLAPLTKIFPKPLDIRVDSNVIIYVTSYMGAMTMGKGFILPNDLLRFSLKQALKRIIPCLVLLVLFGSVLIIWGERIFNNTNDVFRISGYFLIMLIPFALTGVPFKLLDRTYFGVVTDVSLITTIDNESSAWPTIEGAYRKNTIYLTVKLPDGRQIRRKALEARVGSLQPIDRYQKNDRVFHLYGSRYTVILPKSQDKTYICSICGTTNMTDDIVCRACGHTLIKSIKGGNNYEE